MVDDEPVVELPKVQPADDFKPRERPTQRTAPRNLMAQRRKRIILDLRSAGLTYEQVAEQSTQMGYKVTANKARVIVEKALHEMARDDQKNVEQIRQLDLRRIDEAIKILWPKVREGNLKAMREYRAFIDQRSRLLGTYAAQKHEVHGQIDHVIDAGDHAEIARLEEAFLTAAEGDIPDAEVVEVPELPPGD